MTDLVIVVIAACLLAYGLALDWSRRGQDRLVAAWREEDRER